MLTIRTHFTTLAMLSLLVVVSCTPAAEPETRLPFCTQGGDVNESCRYEVGEHHFWLLSSDPQMRVERSLTLTLRSLVPVQIEASELRGLSMYMGRIPVLWRATGDNEWQADLQLGACSDPAMRWQLELDLLIENDSYQWQLPFTSSRP